jgi:predicted Holliday junction resolvase-like endonuclease
VDFSTIVGILDQLMTGGPKAIIAILAFVIVGMFFEIKRLRSQVEAKESKIDKIIDDYYKGNLTLADALTSLKVVLFEIKEHFN